MIFKSFIHVNFFLDCLARMITCSSLTQLDIIFENFIIILLSTYTTEAMNSVSVLSKYKKEDILNEEVEDI